MFSNYFKNILFFIFLPRATPGSSAFYIIFMLLYFYYFTCVLMILRIVHPRTFIYDCPKKAKGMLRTFRSVLWNWFYYFTVGDMFSFLVLLTLSLLGYLKTRICWGGQFNPPPSPMFDVQIWQMIHIGKLLCSTFRICKKICKFAKIEFFIAKCLQKNFSKKWKIIQFWKALDHAISNMQKF